MAEIYFYEMDNYPQGYMSPPQGYMGRTQGCRPEFSNMGRYPRYYPQRDEGNKGAAVCLLVILIIIIIIILCYVFYRSNNGYYSYNKFKNRFLASPEAMRDFESVKNMNPSSPYTDFKLRVPSMDVTKYNTIKKKLGDKTLNADDFDNL